MESSLTSIKAMIDNCTPISPEIAKNTTTRKSLKRKRPLPSISNTELDGAELLKTPRRRYSSTNMIDRVKFQS